MREFHPGLTHVKVQLFTGFTEWGLEVSFREVADFVKPQTLDVRQPLCFSRQTNSDLKIAAYILSIGNKIGKICLYWLACKSINCWVLKVERVCQLSQTAHAAPNPRTQVRWIWYRGRRSTTWEIHFTGIQKYSFPETEKFGLEYNIRQHRWHIDYMYMSCLRSKERHHLKLSQPMRLIWSKLVFLWIFLRSEGAASCLLEGLHIAH